MGSSSWEHILSYIPAKYLSNPSMQPLIKELDQEIHQQYEETIRKTTGKLDRGERFNPLNTFVYFVVQMMLVKPTVNGLTPDPELYKEPLYVILVESFISYKLYAFTSSGLDYSTPWRKRYNEARISLNKSLNIIFPIMQRTLKLWEGYENLLIVDLSTLR